ncbi:MAG: sigma-70 family RNA polymerase sigma factor [Planctomycetes bacterium]|nr:sigma-70 family RNA polymerase sigma factor [Planctomycetota bacterium]
MSETDLRSLAVAGGQGDLDAAEALIKAAHGPLFSFLYLLGVPEIDVDDVAQNTVIQMYQSLSRYDPTLPFSPWLRSIARHVVANYWRTRARERDNRGLFRQHVEHCVVRDEPAAPDLPQAGDLEKCIEHLPPKQREVLAMTYFEGRTSDDVSSILHSTPAAIRQMLARTREVLRRCIEAKLASTEHA